VSDVIDLPMYLGKVICIPDAAPERTITSIRDGGMSSGRTPEGKESLAVPAWDS
jgi:hypothetical protein